MLLLRELGRYWHWKFHIHLERSFFGSRLVNRLSGKGSSGMFNRWKDLGPCLHAFSTKSSRYGLKFETLFYSFYKYFLRACWTHLARPGLARWNVECSIYYEKGRITFIIRSIIWWLTVTQGLHARTTCDDWKVIKLCEISSNLFYFCRVVFFFSSVGKSSQCIIFFSLSIPRRLFHDSHRRDHDDDSLPCTQNKIFPFSPNKVNF